MIRRQKIPAHLIKVDFEEDFLPTARGSETFHFLFMPNFEIGLYEVSLFLTFYLEIA
ncbi:MAG: hypothetical protein AAGI49_13950 [Bacteroidota bacterium]